MADDVIVRFGDITKTYPVLAASSGKSVVDVHSFSEDFPLYLYDQGFKSTAGCTSTICYIDGDRGELSYRGYPIEQLSQNYPYTQICQLLLSGELPSRASHSEFLAELCKYQHLPEPMTKIVGLTPKDSHPMALLSTLMAATATFSPCSLPIEDAETCTKFVMQALAQMPLLVGAAIRHSQGLSMLNYDPELDYIENCFYLLSAQRPSAIQKQALNTILILHAEHEQNASTHTVHTTASTGTHPLASFGAGIAALWGPAHGGANEACMHMLREIGHVDNIASYLRKAKDKNDPFRLMGFGHRVYKNHDPRANIMRKLCHQVLKSTETNDLFVLAIELERQALSDDYFIQRKLYPNVDFYSGITLQALGIPSRCFTAIFALARISGWVSHWQEMMHEQRLIVRPRQRYTGMQTRSL